MLNILKNSFNILKNNLIFIQPLLLFLLIFMTALSYIANKGGFVAAKIILCLSVFLLIAAFSAGWFYIIKNAVLSYNLNDTKEEITVKSLQNFKKFFEGVGEGFIKSVAAYLILSLIFLCMMYCASKFCLKVFGEPQFITMIPKIAKASSQAEILNLLNGVSPADKLIFSGWVLVINTVCIIFNYIFLIYFAAIYFSGENIVKSFLNALKTALKNIFASVFIMAFVFGLYMAINILSMVFGSGIFGILVLTLLLCLYLNYYVILVFCFYNERTKNNSNNRTEFIG